MGKTVFLSRNKPQGADVIDICEKYDRTFIGYPAWRKGYPDLSDLAKDMIDLSCPNWAEIEKELNEECRRRNYKIPK